MELQMLCISRSKEETNGQEKTNENITLGTVIKNSVDIRNDGKSNCIKDGGSTSRWANSHKMAIRFNPTHLIKRM